MKFFRVMTIIVVVGLMFVAGCNCGRSTPPAQPATDTAVAAAAPVLEQAEEQQLATLEASAPAYQPVTKDNYQQELASLEAEVKADLQ